VRGIGLTVGRCLTVALGLSVPLFSSACGGPSQSQLPRGDQLDELLGLLAVPDLYEAAFERCAKATGVGDSRATLVDESLATLPSDGSSGIVAAVIEGVVHPAPTEPEEAPVDSSVRMDGVDYPGGCSDFAQAQVALDPAETMRLTLLDQYSKEVGARLLADERTAALSRQWSSCMDRKGYPDLARPGSQLQVIQAEVARAGADLIRLNDALQFDRLISLGAKDCYENIQREQFAVRLEYENRFVDLHRAELESLVVVRDEHAKSPG
jgi:hypothetical protein